jgi:hydroxyacylglutathione hydrolase
MMQIKAYRNQAPPRLTEGSFAYRNPNVSYLLSSGGDKGRCVLIDAGIGAEAIMPDLREKRLTPDAVLLTHTHRDHIFLLPELAKQFPDIKIGVHKSAVPALSAQGYGNLLRLEDGMVVGTGGATLSVIHAPGHTADSLCFWDREGNNFFSGDVIFGGNIGCSDYGNGGNRNIFYQTILRLMKLLPDGTSVYPGHYSEIHRTEPPYSLVTEKDGNPYLANALGGKRGNFDRALKIFSVDFETNDYVLPDERDIEKIVALEKTIWIPELQASRDTILTRIRRGHRLLAGIGECGLSGMVGWCYSKFSLSDGRKSFPRTFEQFSTCESCSTSRKNSAFIYNVGIIPAAREKGMGSLLLQRAFDEIRKERIAQVFLDSRLPSYNGSQSNSHENVPPNSSFRNAIDGYFTRNLFPRPDHFALDPAIRFYLKSGFKPWSIMRDFINDAPSGNMRVICYLNLERDEGPFPE